MPVRHRVTVKNSFPLELPKPKKKVNKYGRFLLLSWTGLCSLVVLYWKRFHHGCIGRAQNGQRAKSREGKKRERKSYPFCSPQPSLSLSSYPILRTRETHLCSMRGNEANTPIWPPVWRLLEGAWEPYMDVPEVILNLSARTLGLRDHTVRCDITRKRSFVKHGVNDSLRVTVPQPRTKN